MADQIELNRTSLPLPYQLQAKRKGSGVRTWFVVSKLGNSRIEELGKQAIMLRSGVQANDLRVVESELSNPSAILRRERAIVVNLEHIKAIITANEVLVPNPKDPFMGSFVCDLEFKLSDFGKANMVSNKAMEQSLSNMPPEASDRSHKSPTEWSNRGNSKPLPFEFRAFEICLESVCRSLESETSTLEEEAYPALDVLSAKTSTHNLKHVRVIKGRLVALSGRVQKVRDEFEHLLDDDLDMAQMYLTDRLATLQSEGLEDELENDANAFKSGNDSDEDMSSKSSTIDVSDLKPNVEELEMLLGAYFVQIEGILNKLSTLREYIHNTEDYINIVLDDKQNLLLRIGIIITTGGLMLNSGVVASGFLSTNIDIPLFTSGTFAQWYGAAGGIIACSIALFAIFILLFKWLKLLV
ncbi:magnesium transporter MRS2-F-like isoform X1 [Camellia sinensis]|uniref:magnesium transporter MRS2-F-like isoform X1 n=1 Tax=Camellia sinensis TaxID=4442 RepID=UPI0010363E7A|nr:magnesium transporter MRS2-F-like isoform X1 [Camellia sinensis]